LHIAQQMPLPLTISGSGKSRLVLPFWFNGSYLSDTDAIVVAVFTAAKDFFRTMLFQLTVSVNGNRLYREFAELML